MSNEANIQLLQESLEALNPRDVDRFKCYQMWQYASGPGLLEQLGAGSP